LERGDTEVSQDGLVELGDQYVLWLHVPVQQTGAVRCLKSPRDLDANLDNLAGRERAALADAVGEGLPAQLEDKDRAPLGRGERPVQSGHVGMVAEQGERSQFLFKDLDEVRRGVGHTQHLQGNGTTGPELDRSVHGGECPARELRDVCVAGEGSCNDSFRRVPAPPHLGPLISDVSYGARVI
jgi:hypothetical protein